MADAGSGHEAELSSSFHRLEIGGSKRRKEDRVHITLDANRDAPAVDVGGAAVP